jgi:hypothetical protein
MAVLGGAAGCGTNNSGFGQTDPGTGSGTLLVNGDIAYVTDTLSGTLAVPVEVRITSPDMTKPIDAHMLANGALLVTWAGPAADRADVRTRDFHPQPFQPDPLQMSIPAMVLQDPTQELDITRQSSVALAGGAPGSRLTVQYDDQVTMIITAPFRK